MLIDGFVDLVLAELKSQPNLMLGAIDIWNMAQCLDYQSCEVKGWADQDAYWIIDGIKNEAGRIMASCNNKISWSYDHDSWRAYIKREREKANARYENGKHRERQRNDDDNAHRFRMGRRRHRSAAGHQTRHRGRPTANLPTWNQLRTDEKLARAWSKPSMKS